MKSKKNTQKVGFTTIKMEDGLRCDPCSCFYLDKNDYLKHMTQFHKKNGIPSPRKRRRKRNGGCTECCKWCDCTGIHLNKELITLPIKQTKKKNTNLLLNIQSRWKGISKQLYQNIKTVKEEPSEDPYYDLLSKVEVNIKTEQPEISNAIKLEEVME